MTIIDEARLLALLISLSIPALALFFFVLLKKDGEETKAMAEAKKAKLTALGFAKVDTGDTKGPNINHREMF